MGHPSVVPTAARARRPRDSRRGAGATFPLPRGVAWGDNTRGVLGEGLWQQNTGNMVIRIATAKSRARDRERNLGAGLRRSGISRLGRSPSIYRGRDREESRKGSGEKSGGGAPAKRDLT